MNKEHWNYIKNLSRHFNQVRYVAFQDYQSPIKSPEKLAKIDQSKVQIVPNESWYACESYVGKLLSLRGDLRRISTHSGPTVTYTFFPGFYSFLLAPAVIRAGDVNTAYFGNDAIDAVEGESSDSLLGTFKQWFYPQAQKYVLNNVDLAFVRDPRMLQYDNAAKVIESNPITPFNLQDGSRSSTDIPLNEPIELLFIANYRPVKGHIYLLRALKTLRETTDRHYRLRLVGDGVKKLRPTAESLDVTEYIDFNGFIGDKEILVKQYAESDIFVLPSLSEGFPRVLNESMIMGTPIVTTRVGGIPMVLEDRTNALLVAPEEPGEIVSAVAELVNDDQLRERITRNAWKTGSEYFEKNPVEQHIEKII